MKTTIELPDSLIMALKLRALEQHKKLKDLVREILEVGLARTSESRRKNFPIFSMENGETTSQEELQQMIDEGRRSRL